MDLPAAVLSPTVVETYLEYKRRQKILIAWLCQNGQLRNDQEKRDRNTFDTNLSVSDLEDLTQDILARSITVPEDIIYSARKMLRMRKEVALHYRGDEKGHQSCILIFEKIVTILESLPRLPPTFAMSSTTNSEIKTQETVKNTFAVLPPVQLQGLGSGPFQDLALIKQRITVARHGNQRNLLDPGEADPTEVDEQRESAINVLGYLYGIASALKTTMLVLSKARQGLVAPHIAAYVAERAFLKNSYYWKLFWLRISEESTVKSNIGSPDDKLQDIFEELRSWALSETVTRTCPVDRREELLEPYKCLENFSKLPKVKEGLVPTLDTTSISRQVGSYKDMVPSFDSDDKSDYYDQLLLDINVAQAIRGAAAISRDALVCPSRVLDLSVNLVIEPNPPTQMYWSNSLHFLLRAAQSFEFGHTKGGVPIPSDELKPAVNCRLKTLALTQEVSKSLEAYIPSSEAIRTGYSTLLDLEQLQLRLEKCLKDNRFDRVTQHPIIAGSEIFLVLDWYYRLGMQLLAFQDTFLGCLHVYNALLSLDLVDEIPVLETLCDKFLEAAFYGHRPSRKFLKAWDYLNSPFDSLEANSKEMKIIRNNRKSMQDDCDIGPLTFVFKDKDMSPTWILSERVQYMYEESRLNYNTRLHASKHSFCHRIFSQKRDTSMTWSDELLEEICGDKADFFKIPKSRKGKRKLDQNEIDGLLGEDYSDLTNYLLSKLEEATVKELSDPFPLMSANLIRVFHHCHSILSKILVKEGRDSMFGPRLCLKDVLRQCDQIVVENKDTSETEMEESVEVATKIDSMYQPPNQKVNASVVLLEFTNKFLDWLTGT